MLGVRRAANSGAALPWGITVPAIAVSAIAIKRNKASLTEEKKERRGDFGSVTRDLPFRRNRRTLPRHGAER